MTMPYSHLRGQGRGSFALVLRELAERSPDLRLFCFLADGERDERWVTAGELDRRASVIAARLRRHVAPGERALLLYPPGLDYLAGFFGCLYAGVVAVPAYPPDPARLARTLPRLDALVADCGASVALCDSMVASAAPALAAMSQSLGPLAWLPTDALSGGEGLFAPARGDDLAFLQYTSGSTRAPRGVMISHENLLDNTAAIARRIRVGGDSVGVSWLPPFHDMGLIGALLTPARAGFPVVFMSPLSFLERPARWVEAVARHRATYSGGPNFAYDLVARKTTAEQRASLDLSSWRVAFTGAETVRPATLSRFAGAFEAARFDRRAYLPCYGLAECTVAVSGPLGGEGARVVEVAGRERVSCGPPVDDHEVAVVDPKTGLACRGGETGEIWVRGRSVARGYWGRPDESREAFLARLSTGEGPFLRTGDLGSLVGGEVVVSGRLKDMIVIRGRNVWPSDVEAAVEGCHPAVRAGNVAAFALERGGEEGLGVVAEIDTRRESVDLASLARSVRAAAFEASGHLPARVTLLSPGALPKTSSGKLQRGATREAVLDGSLVALLDEGRAPEVSAGEVEAAWLRAGQSDEGGRASLLAEALRLEAARVLGVSPDQISPHDRLASLGLDSLGAMALVEAAERAVGVRLELSEVFHAPSLASAAALVASRWNHLSLAAQVSGRVDGEADEAVFLPPPKGARVDIDALLGALSRSGVRLSVEGERLRATAPPGALTAELRAEITRHKAALVALLEAAGRAEIVEPERARATPGQRALWLDGERAGGAPLYHVQIRVRMRGPVEPERLSRAFDAVASRHRALACALVEQGGELLFAPTDPARLELGRSLGEIRARHALPFEAGEPLTRASLAREGEGEWQLVLTQHHAVTDGASVHLLVDELARALSGEAPGPKPPSLFALASAEARYLESGQAEADRAFWRGRLEGLERLDLPFDRRPPIRSFRGEAIPFGIDAAPVRALARQAGTTPSTVLLTVFAALLARLSGKGGAHVAFVASTREGPFSATAGLQVNTLVARLDLGRGPALASIGQTASEVLSALSHRRLPYPELVSLAGHGAEACFVFEGASLVGGDVGGLPWQIETDTPDGALVGGAKFPLTLVVADRGATLEASLEHATDLVARETAERWVRSFHTLLGSVVADPSRPLSLAPWLSPTERDRLLSWGSSPGDFGPFVPTPRLLEASAKAHAEEPAVEVDGARHGYAELDLASARLASWLKERGVGPEARVGLVMSRSWAWVVSVLAVLRSGGAWVGLDSAHPRERLARCLDDSGARLVLTDALHLASGQAPWVAIGEALAQSDALGELSPAEVRPEHAAYVIYTSGSTGTPKGVLLTHAGLSNLVQMQRRLLALAPGDRALAAASPAFDASVFELLAPLCSGSTVVLAPASPLETLARHPVSCATLSPALLSALDPRSLPSLRTLVSAGEACPPALARLWAEGRRFLNAYGPTEATVCSSAFEGAADPLPIGNPTANASLFVLDPRLQPVPAGVWGELYIAGVQLARGYLGRPALTAERFLPCPFGPPGSRMYRTGDVARWNHRGELEYQGRVDHQVKIRGHRIELGEIESVLSGLPGVKQCVVLAREDTPGDRRLVAYVVADVASEGDDRAWREALSRTLPSYMLPSAFVRLESLPLTSSGKVDRKALPAPAAAVSSRQHIAPRTPAEQAVALAMSELLRLERVGAEGHFFELGGHSLLATRLVSLLRARLGVELPVRAVFEAPTVEALALRAEQAERALLPTITPADRTAPLPLSFAQERLWFLDQLSPGSTAYHMPTALRLTGELDTGALEGALSLLVERHEALRTTFVLDQGKPVQQIEPPRPLELEPETVDATALESRLSELLWEPFDLSRGPLFRAHLLRVSPREHVLALGMHHIVSDGWSAGLLTRELGMAYAAFSKGERPELPPLPVQYADFASWQRQHLEGARLEQDISWWKDQLEGAPQVLELPTDRPRPPVQSSDAGIVPLALSAELSAQVDALAREQGATAFMVLLAAFAALLSRHSGQDQLLVGSPIAGRTQAEVEPVVGLFVNTLALRVDLTGSPSFLELLARVRERTLGAHAHQHAPFERVVEAMGVARDLSRSPLVQAMFVLHNNEQPALCLPGLVSSVLDSDQARAKLDLELSLRHEQGRYQGSLLFASRLFSRSSIERLAERFSCLLSSLLSSPTSPVAASRLLPEAEHRWLSALQTGIEGAGPSPSLLERLADHARRAPDRQAVSFGQQSLTYAELHARVVALSSALVEAGAARGRVVALALGRSLDLLVSALAVLRAGSAYLPLDPSLPHARLSLMLGGSGARLLVAPERPSWLSDPSVVCLRPDATGSAELSFEPHPHDAAYAIYTSGSTGTPKGVVVSHGALANLLSSMAREPGLSEADVLCAVTPLSFDIAALELFLPLWQGARLVLASDEQAGDGTQLASLLERSQATVLQTTPSRWQLLLDSGWAGRPALRALCGGEALPGPLADQLRSRVGELWNVYGPTETTIWSTCARVEGEVCLGRPIARTQCLVLDARLEPVPVGVFGELYLGGAGLARGYLGRPALTSERFLPCPFGPPGSRMYRTGDVARWNHRGELEYQGRVDHQVKIRGHRIELGEIESVLSGQPGVKQCVVLAREDTPGDRRLVAYLVADGSTDEQAWKEALSQKLPSYMLPSAFVRLDELPLTTSGKIDRRALPAPAAAVSSRQHVAPRTPAEQAVASAMAELLHLEQVGAEGHFFELGGHSLLATRLVSLLRARLGVELPVRAVFEAPTVEALARLIEQAGKADLPAITPADRTAPLPLSFAQERLWFLDQLSPSSTAYHMPAALRLTGELDVPALSRALSFLVERHEALRTTFDSQAGRPVQRVSSPHPIVLEPEPVSEQSLPGRLRDVLWEPFDLSRGPLFRAHLLRVSPREHVLALGMHHIVSDGWSVGLLLRELSAAYEALSRGQIPAFPASPLQYADFASWQRRHLEGETVERAVSWWKDQLQGAPQVLELPADHPRPPAPSSRGGLVPVTLSAELSQRVDAFAREQGATPFLVLLSAFGALLSRITGREDLLVGSPIAGRTQAETEPLVGLFVNTLALRVDLRGAPSFVELVGRVRERTLGAHAHQHAPFERVVEAMGVARDRSRSPLVQVMFALQNTEAASLSLAGLESRPIELDGVAAKVDLELSLGRAEGAYRGSLVHAADLFDRSTVERLAERFSTLLSSLLGDRSRPVSLAPLLSGHERRELLLRGEGERFCGPFVPASELVSAAALSRPCAVAVEVDGARHGYADLDLASARLASWLKEQGVGPEVRVGLVMSRSWEWVVSVLAVLRAGGAWVGLDSAHPRERLARCLDDSGARLVLTDALHLAAGQAPWVAIGEALAQSDALGELSPAEVRPEHAAYVIYTSGSTGTPKGVLLTHGGLSNLVQMQRRLFALGEHDRALVMASPAFDASVSELLVPLCSGSTLVLSTSSPDQTLRERHVTCATLTPALLSALDPASLPSLRTLVSAGEACPPALARLWAEGRRFLNAYGPTEATVCSSAFEGAADPLPIGNPTANTSLFVLDPRLQPVPAGVWGELYIAGVQLARGYLGRPGLTAERFLPCPFGPPGSRMYRTGDVARWNHRGELEYQGRVDHQVKLRGHRIELGEIESVLSAERGVRQCVVLAREDTPGDRRLVAYLVAEGSTDEQAWREALSRKLPSYMLPSAFVRLESLPLTTSGKIDRRALPAPGAGASSRHQPPRTPGERQVAGAFAEVLGVGEVGAFDSFFALGGHSLSAMRLVARLAELTGRRVAVSQVFESPSVEALARALSTPEAGEPIDGLVELRAARAPGATPLVLVHAMGGGVGMYAALARSFPGDGAVYGLLAPGLERGGEPLDSVEALARHHARTLARAGLGPVVLGGWSFGGLLALALSREVPGVEGVLLLDTHLPRPGEGPPPPLLRLLGFVRDVLGQADIDPLRRASEGWFLAESGDALAAISSWKRSGALPASAGLETIERLWAVSEAHHRALAGAPPPVSPSPVVLIAAEGRELEPGWGEVAAAGLAVVEAKGDHAALLSLDLSRLPLPWPRRSAGPGDRGGG